MTNKDILANYLLDNWSCFFSLQKEYMSYPLQNEPGKCPLVMTPRGTVRTILLADDDESCREFTKTVLAAFGYRVVKALAGEGAIEKFKEHRDSIQLLILDVVMPKKNGREAYDRNPKDTTRGESTFYQRLYPGLVSWR